MQYGDDMAITLLDRARAAAIHGVFSLLLLLVALWLVFHVWYPTPLPQAAGVTSIYYLILAIDLVIGPALTFFVFKRDRLKFVFDMVVIVLVQMAFYLYGLMIVAQGRPEWLVFVVDDFEMVRPVDIDRREEQSFLPAFRETLWDGPRWVAAHYSDDPEVAQRQKEDELFLGISMATRPETFADISGSREKILGRARAIEALSDYNPSPALSVLQDYPQAMGWLPLKGFARDQVVLVDDAGYVLGVVDLRPWD